MTVHRKIEASNGNTWLVPVEGFDIAGSLHVDKHEYGEDRTSYPRMRGYGGAVLEFNLDDGSIYSAKGPWHSNSDAFFEDTGILVSDLYLTRITLIEVEATVTEGRESYNDVKVIYEEKDYVLGPYMRGERIAHQLANITGKPVRIKNESRGGSSEKIAFPFKQPHTMGTRGDRHNDYKDEAWEANV